jgi:hypothetical protein
MIFGENYTVNMDNPNLPMVKEKFHYPALYNGGLPAEILPEPLFKKRIRIIKWADFFQYQTNKMITFQIIPHADVTNNTKRLWKAIYKMYEMYETTGSRIERQGLKFTYREKDRFWFDVIFKQEKGQKKIEFYVSTSEYQAQKLKRKLENKMSITMKAADIQNLQVPFENTIVQEMKYLNHDIFSLNTNSQDTKTPIANILNTIDELTFDGDFARLSICNEIENRRKWVKTAQWAFEKLSKGKVPQRANAGGKMLSKGLKTSIAGVLNEINSLLTDTFQAINNSFFKSEKEFKKEKVIKKAYSLEDEIGTSRISHEKANTPVFKSRIRVISHSKDRLTRETIGETLALSFADLAETNELTGVKVKINGRVLEVIEELNTLQLSKKTKLDPNANIISTDEMSKLALQMPVKELQRKYADELKP